MVYGHAFQSKKGYALLMRTIGYALLMRTKIRTGGSDNKGVDSQLNQIKTVVSEFNSVGSNRIEVVWENTV